MSGILIYYLVLFALVAIFNFFKVIKQEKLLFSEPNNKYKNYFLFSQEIILTSSGIVLMLTEKIHNTYVVLAVFFLFLLFVVSSSLINTLEDKYAKTIFNSNIIIILVAFASVVSLFIFVFPNIEAKTETNNTDNIKKKDSTITTYTIVIPYKDNSLIKHIGRDNFGNRQLAFITTLDLKNKKCAIDSAIKIFNDANITRPLFPIIKGVEYKTDADYDKIIIEKKTRKIEEAEE
jgi:hypothetical protein